jgi:hypothetical protein
MLPPSLPSNGPKFCSHQVGLYTTITWQDNSPTRPRQWQASAEVPKLSAALAAQIDPWQRLAQLTDELSLKSALLEQTEANGRRSTARADIAAGAKGRRTCEQCKRSSTSCRCLATSTVRALQEATSRATDEQIRRYETELGEVHAELEANNSKLEAVRLRSADVENG